MIKLALPGMIMIEAQFSVLEILTIAAGQFGTAQLAAQSVLVTVTSTSFNIPFPLAIATSTRVANLIGARLSDAARTTAKVVSASRHNLHASFHPDTNAVINFTGHRRCFHCWLLQPNHLCDSPQGPSPGLHKRRRSNRHCSAGHPGLRSHADFRCLGSRFSRYSPWRGTAGNWRLRKSLLVLPDSVTSLLVHGFCIGLEA